MGKRAGLSSASSAVEPKELNADLLLHLPAGTLHAFKSDIQKVLEDSQ